jgi:hypothetical protein
MPFFADDDILCPIMPLAAPAALQIVLIPIGLLINLVPALFTEAAGPKKKLIMRGRDGNVD